MFFSDMINPVNISEQNAFLLWMIYERPIFLDDYTKILAYSWYKVWWWSRSKIFIDNVGKDTDYYLNAHLEKLKWFLWKEYDILLNTKIKDLYEISNNKSIEKWVSVVIDFDLDLPSDVNVENYITLMILYEPFLITIQG